MMWSGRWSTCMPVRMWSCRNGWRTTPVTISRPCSITAAVGLAGMSSPAIAMWMPRLLTWRRGLPIAMCRPMWSALSARRGEAPLRPIRLQQRTQTRIGTLAISLHSGLILRAPCPFHSGTRNPSRRTAPISGRRRQGGVGCAG